MREKKSVVKKKKKIDYLKIILKQVSCAKKEKNLERGDPGEHQNTYTYIYIYLLKSELG